MGKKGGEAGEGQPRSDIKTPPSSTTQEAKSESVASQPKPLHQTQQQQDPQISGTAATTSSTVPQHQQETPQSNTHQVIAVSASKGPAAFFNLARKFLVTDEYCDLSALEGAIVSAVDAAHLLERSKLADIVRYVFVYSHHSSYIAFLSSSFSSYFSSSSFFLESKHHMYQLNQNEEHNNKPLQN